MHAQDLHVGPASPSAAAAASAAAAGLDPNRITIVALLNMADYTTHTHTSVPFDQPLFDPVPRRVEYSQYKPFETYTTIITLRNKDNVCLLSTSYSAYALESRDFVFYPRVVRIVCCIVPCPVSSPRQDRHSRLALLHAERAAIRRSPARSGRLARLVHVGRQGGAARHCSVYADLYAAIARRLRARSDGHHGTRKVSDSRPRHGRPRYGMQPSVACANQA